MSAERSAPAEVARATRKTLAALEKHGLLLEQDRELPSVVALVTGDVPRGSWWSHPRGRLVFAVLASLAEDEDVLFTKLVARKVTLVHRRLWPALLTIVMAREAWQVRGLSPAARRALRDLEQAEQPVRASSAVAKELDRKLLAVTREVHTAAGKHALVVESWGAWSARAKCRRLRSVAQAWRTLDEARTVLGAPRAALPWGADAGE